MHALPSHAAVPPDRQWESRMGDKGHNVYGRTGQRSGQSDTLQAADGPAN